jgi:carboxypeptidase T
VVPKQRSRRTQVLLSIVILSTSVLFPRDRSPASLVLAEPFASAQRFQQAFPSLQYKEPLSEARWVVRAYYHDRQMIADLAAWREPWEVHHAQGYVVLDVNRAEFERLASAGFRLEIDARLTAALNAWSAPLPGQNTGIPGFACYRTVEETFAAAEAIVAEHPTLAAWSDIGDSWEKWTAGGQPGYDLMVLRLTNSGIPGPKPKLFAMASIHAREYAPAELLVRFAEHLVSHYAVDADVTWLLDYHEIHLLLQANPDGRKWAETGLYWRKNTDNNHCADTDWRGVDLNRNFDFQWGCCGGSSFERCSEVYRGPAAASEPETKAVQDYLRAHFPDRREPELSAAAPITTSGVFLDIHSYSELVLWPWGSIEAPAPNGRALQTLGRKFAFFNKYRPQQASELYPADGTSDGFAYGELGLASYTFELGTRFFQYCDTFENTILPDNVAALTYAAKVARTPYVTPTGPDVIGVSVVPGTAALGESVQLSATIDDTRYSALNGLEPTQRIVAAEYYLDTPPWVPEKGAAPYALAPSDGDFDHEIESVRGVLDTTGLAPGRHTLFVRGRDADGNWGAFTAAFVDVFPLPDSYFLPLVLSGR